VTDRDDTRRIEHGWTGSEDTDFEPDTGPTLPQRRAPEPPHDPAIPGRPPVDYVPAKPKPTPPASDDDGDPQAGHDTADLPQPPTEEQPRSSFREPTQRQQPPQQTAQHAKQPAHPPHDGRPALSQPDGNPWEQQPGWPMHLQRPQSSPPPPAPPTPQPPHSFGPQLWPVEGGFVPDDSGQHAPHAVPGSYADRIRVNDLVPPRPEPPAGGWRLLVYKASFGLINPGPSAEDVRQAELEAKIRGVLRGHYKVGVMGKGGVGKTTVSASVGSVFAELRQDDRVVAIDADTAFGKLGSRVDPRAQGSYWELASDKHLDTFADVRSRVGNNAAGLFVLAGEGSPARRRVLDAAIYREATTRLDRHFSISVVDCSSTMDSPVTHEVLRDLDALIVVSSPWVDGAAAAGQTLDWLANRGMTSLLQRTVVVLNDSDGHADKRTRSILAGQFAGQGQRVVEVPFDGNLRPGGVIEGTRVMTPSARRKFLEIAAALADHFPSSDDRHRERF
jgi:MinD-like ATPase involved in chromosome partitioning or flagellar assembly